MTNDLVDRNAEQEREIEILRARVADLERLLQRSSQGHIVDPKQIALGEREALLLEAESGSRTGTWVWDVVTNDVFWSDELYRILGYDPTHDKAATEAFFARFHPEDVGPAQAAMSRGLASGQPEQIEFRVVLPSGEIRYAVSTGAYLHGPTGGLERAVGTVRDITDLRRASRAVQAALDMLQEAQAIAHVGSWSWDVTTGEVSWSPELRRILGATANEPPSVAFFDSLVHPEDLPLLLKDRQVASDGGAPTERQIRLRLPGGALRYVHIAAKRTDAAPGVLGGFRGIVLDVSERVALEAQLRQAQRLEVIGQLAGGVAHDFNNSLMTILGNVEVLQLQQPSPELTDIRLAANAAASTTRQLLSFSRTAALKRQSTSIDEVIRSAERLLGRTLGEQIRTEFELNSQPWTAMVDPGQVQQAILNLALNARDAMPKGGTLRFRTRKQWVDVVRSPEQQPGPYVVMSVEDTGTGMDRETHARATEPFFTTKPAGSGTGLGLAMVLATAVQSGGFMDLKSELGQGTVCDLYFPRASGSDYPADGPLQSSTVIQAKSRRALVVEDDPAVARITQTLLRSLGLDVVVCLSAREAMSRLQDPAQQFDVLVSDMVMPEVGGLQLAIAARQLRVRLPILFVTGYSPSIGNDDLQKPWALINKPFDRTQLKGILDELLKT